MQADARVERKTRGGDSNWQRAGPVIVGRQLAERSGVGQAEGRVGQSDVVQVAQLRRGAPTCAGDGIANVAAAVVFESEVVGRTAVTWSHFGQAPSGHAKHVQRGGVSLSVAPIFSPLIGLAAGLRNVGIGQPGDVERAVVIRFKRRGIGVQIASLQRRIRAGGAQAQGSAQQGRRKLRWAR